MPALRFFGGVFLLIAAVILIADLTNARGITTAGFSVSLAKHWAKLAPSLARSQSEEPAGDQPLFMGPDSHGSLLKLPAWAWFGLIGALMAWFGRRRRRVNIFVN